MDKNQAYTHLICAAQNMKNIAIKRYNIDNKHSNNIKNHNILTKISKFYEKLLQEKTSHLKMWGLSTVWMVGPLSVLPFFYTKILYNKS